MQTLIAIRNRTNHLNCITTIKDNKGFVKVILTGYQQPRQTKNACIVLRGKEYKLNFAKEN